VRVMELCWGQRALLLPQAFGPGPFAAPVDRELLFALAQQEGVESRLVTAFGGRWSLRHGPFARRDIPARSRPDWTLLVQGVDLHHRPAADLAARFRFLPAARFDDVMVSYASPGGGVGPHVDQYDVFLLQVQGRRRWRIARDFDPALVPGLPLKVLRNFRHEEEFVLEPGDMLYLPPGVAHEGVAIDECITLSVGFRVLPWQEIAEAWIALQAEEAPLRGRMREGRIAVARSPAQVGAASIRAAHAALAGLRPKPAQARRALLCALTEPKAQVWFDPPEAPLAPARFARLALSRGIRTDLRTRLLYAGSAFAINGEPCDEASALPAAARALLRGFADRRSLRGGEIAALEGSAQHELLAILHRWHGNGWIEALAD